MDPRGILDILDLTLLDEGASESELRRLCEFANQHLPAAVCVFAEHAPMVSSMLDDKTALSVVAGGFPVGSFSPEEIVSSIEDAIRLGAEEIDCVLEPRQEEDFPNENELAKLIAMREASQGLPLKVIVEAPLLGERGLRAVTRMVLASGADFVKTCTGKRGACTERDARLISFEVRRHFVSFGELRGVKLSGGLSSKEAAEGLIAIVQSVDESILGPSRLRIGSSSLIAHLIGDGGLGRN